MQKIRVIMEAEIDEETMKERSCNANDVLDGLLIYDSYEADGFIITTRIRGCDNTSDFFLKNGEIKKVELLNEQLHSDSKEPIAVSFVKFKNLLDDEEDISFGILQNDNTVICLCCTGTFEHEDYQIIGKCSVEFDNTSDMFRFIADKEYSKLNFVDEENKRSAAKNMKDEGNKND